MPVDTVPVCCSVCCLEGQGRRAGTGKPSNQGDRSGNGHRSISGQSKVLPPSWPLARQGLAMQVHFQGGALPAAQEGVPSILGWRESLISLADRKGRSRLAGEFLPARWNPRGPPALTPAATAINTWCRLLMLDVLLLHCETLRNIYACYYLFTSAEY